jgi:DNA-binding GntR family transcriptional regulator
MNGTGLQARRALRNSGRGRGRPRGNRADRVFEQLRERILNLELLPHADIDELDLAEEFNTSRTPVREALIRLASEGLVELLPNRCSHVASLDVKDVPAILEALDLMQRVVARWAAMRRSDADLVEIVARREGFSAATKVNDAVSIEDANKKFYVAIGKACGNSHLARWHEGLLNSSTRLAHVALKKAPLQSKIDENYYARVGAAHSRMVVAIQTCDADLAERCAGQHNILFRDRIVACLTENKADELQV